MNKIPKVVHYCWFGGGQEDSLIQACKASWHKNLVGYTIQRWDESNTDLTPVFLQEWYKKKQWAFIADYIRLKVLLQQGGIYLDTDVEVVKPFDDLMHHSFFVGEESTGRVCNAVLGAMPGHPFVAECIRQMESRWESGRSFKIGPEILAAALRVQKFDTVVLPYEYFYPYNPYDPTREVGVLMYGSITSNTYAIHHWNKSWSFSFWERVKRKLGM